jgi:hypothetical protein
MPRCKQANKQASKQTKKQIIQFNSILIYLHANLTAQGQLQSEHELK